jgi:molybdopterin molybdotransferase
MLELEEALDLILASLPAPTGETIPLRQAAGRVLFQTLHSSIDLPRFDNSAMDGYAVRSDDVTTERTDSPKRLRVIGKVAAGSHFSGEVSEGTTVRLFTGSPLPRGANAVVMQEDTKPDPAQPYEILVLDQVKPGENVRLRGEDVACGDVLATAGVKLNFALVSLLGAAGIGQIRVARQPRVAILATGSELQEPGALLGPGQIYESNRVALEELARRVGGSPTVFPIVADELGSTRAALLEAFNNSDLVVTSGGASVGEMDFIKAAFEDAGGKLEFWKVSIKPGRPFVFGRRDKHLFFGLPGNPVSALVTFLLLVRPALLRWQGATDVSLLTHPAILEESLNNSGNRRHFHRVIIEKAGKVRSAGRQESHLLRSFAAATGLVDVPPGTQFPTGSVVQVIRWD